MADNPRIEELRRRVDKDPASIAFAQLAEEYRRSGNLVEAIRVCRAGLTRHPGYLSARVTLGRALLEDNDLDAARAELESVLQAAPENLAAVRGLAEIHHRRGDIAAALTQYRAALALARHDPDLEQTIADLEREVGGKPKPAPKLSLEQVEAEFLSAFAPGPVSSKLPEPEARSPSPGDSPPPVQPAPAWSEFDPRVGALEEFLHAILAYRASLPSAASRR